MSMGKASAPPPPNYQPIAQADTKAAERQFQLGEEQLQWSKDQFNKVWPYAMQYMTSQNGIAGAEAAQAPAYINAQVSAAENQTEAAKKAQDFYQTTYQPIEKAFANTALNYNTPGRASENAARAMADVANTFAAQRKNALQTLESYGIDPSQTRFAALDASTRISQAAAMAAAGTQSRLNTEATGLALQGEAINVGRGYPGSIANAYSTATNAGNAGLASGLNAGEAGLNAANNTYRSGAAAMGTPSGYFGTGVNALGGAANALNMGFNNAAMAAQIQNQNSSNFMSGIGQLIGGGIGLAMMM